MRVIELIERQDGTRLDCLHRAQKAADADITFIETQMAGYYERLDLWYQRV